MKIKIYSLHKLRVGKYIGSYEKRQFGSRFVPRRTDKKLGKQYFISNKMKTHFTRYFTPFGLVFSQLLF